MRSDRRLSRATLALVLALAPVPARAAEELDLFAWSEYVPQSVLDGFTEELLKAVQTLRALGVPVYQLLGGAYRTDVRCYANGWSFRAVTPTRVDRDGWRAQVELADGTYGPLTVPAGKQACRASKALLPGANWPLTFDVMCITWL